jgi:hypothetical protein
MRPALVRETRARPGRRAAVGGLDAPPSFSEPLEGGWDSPGRDGSMVRRAPFRLGTRQRGGAQAPLVASLLPLDVRPYGAVQRRSSPAHCVTTAVRGFALLRPPRRWSICTDRRAAAGPQGVSGGTVGPGDFRPRKWPRRPSSSWFAVLAWVWNAPALQRGEKPTLVARALHEPDVPTFALPSRRRSSASGQDAGPGRSSAPRRRPEGATEGPTA